MIEKLVSDLPEVYQPIYNHPELSGGASRPCLDRLKNIVDAYDALERLLGRPLNVLDLGCAQGYFSLALAQRGAKVHGVDYLDKNISLCQALAQENPQLRASFATGRVEEIIEQLSCGQYDLVLGLSVFHHIIYEKGTDAVKRFFERILYQGGILIVEMALREEPLYWASAQPEDPRALLDSIAFVHEVARHSTHLAPIQRPLFIASNQYWVLEGRAERFDSWSSDSHALARGAHQGSRRYFFSAEYILKLYRFDHRFGDRNRDEFEREIIFLQHPPEGFEAANLILSGRENTNAWLAIQRLPGRLLLDLLREEIAFDKRAVVLAVLHQLALLEKSGLYHDDVRTWNVLVGEDGTTRLIDYGSISACAQDCVWPNNIFLSFLILVREVATGVVDEPEPLRTISISPYGLPQPYRAWAEGLWHRPLAEWSFGCMYQSLLSLPADTIEVPLQQPGEIWMKAMEDAVQIQKMFARHIKAEAFVDREQFRQMFSALAESHKRELALSNTALTSLGAQYKAAEDRVFVSEARAQRAEQCIGQAEARALELEARAEQAEARMLELTQLAEQAEAMSVHKGQQAEIALAKVKQVEADLGTARKELHAVHQANHHHWQLADARLHALQAVHQSFSWKLTAPFRFGGGLLVHPGATLRNTANYWIRNSIQLGRKPLSRLMVAVLRRPQLSYRINQWLLRRCPALHRQLLAVGREQGIVITAQTAPSPVAVSVSTPMDRSLENMTSRAREIYASLKVAVKKEDGVDDANCH
ncbi:MAG: methyltransferase domain-containing protein [Comamonadaceae bacterium]|nr:methyltransferase domain-containing protein [Comamonadaceae bacterium]